MWGYLEFQPWRWFYYNPKKGHITIPVYVLPGKRPRMFLVGRQAFPLNGPCLGDSHSSSGCRVCDVHVHFFYLVYNGITSYRGINRLYSTIIRIPMKPPGFNGKSPAVPFFFVSWLDPCFCDVYLVTFMDAANLVICRVRLTQLCWLLRFFGADFSGSQKKFS